MKNRIPKNRPASRNALRVIELSKRSDGGYAVVVYVTKPHPHTFSAVFPETYADAQAAAENYKQSFTALGVMDTTQGVRVSAFHCTECGGYGRIALGEPDNCLCEEGERK